MGKVKHAVKHSQSYCSCLHLFCPPWDSNIFMNPIPCHRLYHTREMPKIYSAKPKHEMDVGYMHVLETCWTVQDGFG